VNDREKAKESNGNFIFDWKAIFQKKSPNGAFWRACRKMHFFFLGKGVEGKFDLLTLKYTQGGF